MFTLQVYRSLFKIIFILHLLIDLCFASGNTSGGGGKSSVQATDGSLSVQYQFDGVVDDKVHQLSIHKSKVLDHSRFDAILSKVVHWNSSNTGTRIDYDKVDLNELTLYINELTSLSKAHIDKMNVNSQKAYYINLYNALTLKLVKAFYPVESIKELGSGFPFFRSPWKKKFFHLFGRYSYLDQIEHELVRGNEKLLDPLLHFAFNCASIGCPALSDQSYSPDQLDQQLESAAISFLSDRSRNYFKGDTLYVSSIFKWYESDFTSKMRNVEGLKSFFSFYAKHLSDGSPEILSLIVSGKYAIEFLPYNWDLNNQF